MSSTNDVSKVTAISAIEAILKRERQKKELQKQKNIEVGLTAAALTGLGATAGTQLAKEALDQKRKYDAKMRLEQMNQNKMRRQQRKQNGNLSGNMY